MVLAGPGQLQMQLRSTQNEFRPGMVLLWYFCLSHLLLHSLYCFSPTSPHLPLFLQFCALLLSCVPFPSPAPRPPSLVCSVLLSSNSSSRSSAPPPPSSFCLCVCVSLSGAISLFFPSEIAQHSSTLAKSRARFQNRALCVLRQHFRFKSFVC
jgi:hypothetical protein